MSIVPESRVARVQFYETLSPVWAAHAPALGVPQDQADRVVALARAARQAYAAAQEARVAAQAATLAFNLAVKALHAGPGAGQDTIALIRITAQRTDDPAVYTTARLPPPSPPARAGSVPPPGTPTDFRVQLLPTGSLRLSWACRNPRRSQGTIYQVRRRIGEGLNEMALVGVTGARSLIDAGVPAGAASVTYEIIALRSTARGTPARFTVPLGASGHTPSPPTPLFPPHHAAVADPVARRAA